MEEVSIPSIHYVIIDSSQDNENNQSVISDEWLKETWDVHGWI